MKTVSAKSLFTLMINRIPTASLHRGEHPDSCHLRSGPYKTQKIDVRHGDSLQSYTNKVTFCATTSPAKQVNDAPVVAV